MSTGEFTVIAVLIATIAAVSGICIAYPWDQRPAKQVVISETYEEGDVMDCGNEENARALQNYGLVRAGSFQHFTRIVRKPFSVEICVPSNTDSQ